MVYLEPLPETVLMLPQFKQFVPLVEIRYINLEYTKTKKDIKNILEIGALHIKVEYSVVERWQKQICIDRNYVPKLFIESVERVLIKTLNDCEESEKCCKIIENKNPPYIDEIKENIVDLLKLSEDTKYFANEIKEFI